jgi:ribosomal protein S21
MQLHTFTHYVKIFPPMTNVEIRRNQNENALNTIRRFTKKVQGSGVLPRVRGTRYAKRILSPYKIKKLALKVIARRAEVQELIKMGKAPDRLSK